MSTVLPSGSPARAGEPPDKDGDAPTPPQPDGAPATAARSKGDSSKGGATRGAARERLHGWPAPIRVPLQVLGHTIAKAWHDRILGLSAEAAFWQVLSVPPLLIGLLGSLGYLGNFIGKDS